VRRHRRGLTIVLTTLGLLVLGAIAVVVTVATVYVHLGDGIGEHSYSPASAAALHDRYRLGIGRLSLDLSQLPLRSHTITVNARVGIGELDVTVPKDATVRVLGNIGWGDADLLGRDENGHNVSSEVGAATPQLLIDARV